MIQRRQDIVFRQLGEIVHDLPMRHAGGKPAEYVNDSDPHLADAWAAATLAGSTVIICLSAMVRRLARF